MLLEKLREISTVSFPFDMNVCLLQLRLNTRNLLLKGVNYQSKGQRYKFMSFISKQENYPIVCQRGTKISKNIDSSFETKRTEIWNTNDWNWTNSVSQELKVQNPEGLDPKSYSIALFIFIFPMRRTCVWVFFCFFSMQRK